MRIRFFFLLVATVLFSVRCYSEDKQIDSLINSINTTSEDSNKVNTLNLLSKKFFNTDADKSILYGKQAIELADKLNFKHGLAYAYKNTGIGYFNKGDYKEALKYYESSLAAFQSMGDKKGSANMFLNVGNVYYQNGVDDKALEFYLKSLKYSEEIKDTLRIVTALGNVGAIYGKKKQTYEDAIKYYRQAYPLSIAINDSYLAGINALNIGEVFMVQNAYDSALYYFNISLPYFDGGLDSAYALNNIGRLYRRQKMYDKAIHIQKHACELAEKLDSKDDMAISITGLAKSYLEKGDLKESLLNFRKAEKIANETGANYTLLDIYTGLSEIYTKNKDFENTAKYQTLLLNIKDSIYNIETDKKSGTLQFTFDLEKKESKINLLTKDNEIQDQVISRQKLVRNSFIGGFAIMLISAVVFFRQRNKITKEKHRSEQLLLNILPEETAEELKHTGTAKTKSFDSVTVLFTDFKNFTQASEILTAVELVQEIHHCYSEFDRIVEKHNLEKIKTIGDSYMCAGGLPVANTTHPVDAVRAGLEMQQFIERNKEERIAKGLPYFELRLGIHTGHVVAGVVGTKKFAYDIWGDTVNTASRMESSGEIGKVNISGVTYELIKNEFKCVHRGKIHAKNKGDIDMYFVGNTV
jgi:adenylate cyclase